MKIYDWILQNNLSIKQACNIFDCHRQTLRHVQHDIAIDEKIAMRIRVLTINKVIPCTRKVGRPKKLSTKFTGQKNDNDKNLK